MLLYETECMLNLSCDIFGLHFYVLHSLLGIRYEQQEYIINYSISCDNLICSL